MENPRSHVRLDKFVALAAQSGLITQEALDERLDPLLARLIDRLVAEGLLTRWQCEKLLGGKYRGFFLDGYKLLGHLETDDTCSTYLVVEVATGHKFAMRVTPKTANSHSDKIEYEIVLGFL